ncbi:MAG: hypothetical protein R3E53_06655 [Myxococcota bacterium]
MKLSITKSEFLRGLGRIQSIVEKRNSMPILANVLIEAPKKGKEERLQLAATDLEAVGIRSQHPAEVEGGRTGRSRRRSSSRSCGSPPTSGIDLESTSNLPRDPLQSQSLHARRDRGGGVSDPSRV